MPSNPIQMTFIIGFIILAAANLFISFLTIIIKAQKYGIADTWQNPDSFAVGTLGIGLGCLGVAYWFYKKRLN